MATTFSAPLFGEVATALAAYFEGLHNSDATRLAELCAHITSSSFASSAASLMQALCHVPGGTRTGAYTACLLMEPSWSSATLILSWPAWRHDRRHQNSPVTIRSFPSTHVSADAQLPRYR